MEKSTIIPTIRYKDAPGAIDWLCKAFGFEKHMVVPGEGNTVAHAQLVLNGAMVMLGSSADDEFGKNLKRPEETGGYNTQTIYVIVNEVDEHYRRSKAAGASILLDIQDMYYGGREYTCKDPEGHIWGFGSYDPWHKE